MRILIVDPSRVFQEMVKQVLAGVALEVVSSDTACEALKLAGKRPFDVVCSAYLLPDMSGITFCRSYRKLSPVQLAPFLLLTSMGEGTLSQEALAAGVTEVFQRDHLEELLTYLQRFACQNERIEARVLLVEDTLAQRTYYLSTLEECGLKVSAVSDAQSALDLLQAQPFDLVISDIVLDGPMSGIGLANAIRRAPGRMGETPILALTAFDDLNRRIELFHLGVNDYVIKPVAEAELRTRVRNLVLMRRLLNQLHDAEEAAQSDAATLLRAIEQVSSGVAIAAQDGRITYANAKFASIARIPSDRLIGLPLATFDAEATSLLNDTIRGERVKRRGDGSTYWAFETISPVRDTEGATTHYIAIQEDTSETHALRNQVEYHANHDHLTGLLNRRELDLRLERALQGWRAAQVPATLVICDIGNLRSTNDAFGFEAGDTLLKQVAAFLEKETAREESITARIESGRMALLLNAPSEAATQIIERLAKQLMNFYVEWQGKRLSTRLAIGIAHLSEDTDCLETWLHQADSAAHVARTNAPTHIAIFDSSDPRILERHGTKAWLKSLHEALAQDGLRLVTQLIYPLRHELPPGQEFLLRLQSKTGELIAPGHFLPTAERYGLMPRIDHWVLKHALEWIGRQGERLSPETFFNINLSGQSLNDPQFIEQAGLLLGAAGTLGERLCFEVTETVAIQTGGAFNRFVELARRHRCRLALDDFGSGFASYGQLKHSPVQILKIDGALVRRLDQDAVDRAMVRSIGEIGRAMNMLTIAEFVENAETLSVLRALNIDYAQGYFLGKPTPLG